jgi:serine/threonine protein kinase
MTSLSILDSPSSFTSDDSFASNGSPTEPLQDLTMLRPLGKSRFQIFLAFSQATDKYYAVKIFPFKENKISKYYTNESRFAYLSHPNIISNLAIKPEVPTLVDGSNTTASEIVMELSPYGDFTKVILSKQFPRDEALTRTYFHQLINAIEYLHSNGVAHLDLKTPNLLLGEDYELKVTDFDCSYKKGDGILKTAGTPDYRAPELKNRKCKKPMQADIYSCGVILFVLLFHRPPCVEDDQTLNLYQLMMEKSPKFWEMHEKNTRNLRVSDEFKELFHWMVREQPTVRPSIQEIKQHPWYNGPIYSRNELLEKMKNIKRIH